MAAPPQLLRNPLTRELARRLAEAEWSATITQIDFPYTIEDEEIAGVKCARYRAGRSDPGAPLIFYLHAGAFISGSPRINAAAVLPSCHLAGFEGLGVDYSLAPDAVFPAQLDEIERVYLAVTAGGRPASRLVLMGDSAGGALALSSLHRWRKKGLPMPAGVVLMSPVADATSRSDTYHTLKGRDPVFGSTGVSGIATVYDLYAPGEDRSNPEVSPIEGDFAGMPPMLIHVGSREIFLGDSARLAEKARRAGVDVSLRVFDGLFHLFHLHWELEDAKAAHQDIAAFIARTAGAAFPTARRACSSSRL
ncbi:MAG: alpha/beta hydrolase [Parvularculaceae bacterium]